MPVMLKKKETKTPFVRTSRSDRIAALLIGGMGLVVLSLLAWGHLGLGALIFPPAATAAHQTTSTGAYHVTFNATSGQLTAHGPNAVLLVVTDTAGKAITGATIHVQPEMTTMNMANPSYDARELGNGTYSVQPQFAMAGDWRLVTMISMQGNAPQQAAFIVSVHWNR